MLFMKYIYIFMISIKVILMKETDDVIIHEINNDSDKQ